MYAVAGGGFAEDVARQRLTAVKVEVEPIERARHG